MGHQKTSIVSPEARNQELSQHIVSATKAVTYHTEVHVVVCKAFLYRLQIPL